MSEDNKEPETTIKPNENEGKKMVGSKDQNTPKIDANDIFVTEKDTFEIELGYYKEDGKIIVEDIDADIYDPSKSQEPIKMTLKFPDQSDCYTIANSVPAQGYDPEKGLVDLRDFIKLELTRLNILARKWNINKTLNSSNILNMHPKIIKGLVAKVRQKINMEGIF